MAGCFGFGIFEDAMDFLVEDEGDDFAEEDTVHDFFLEVGERIE